MTKALDYKLDNEVSRREFVQKEESSVYGGVNGNGEGVAVMLQNGVGMELRTYQKNGWIRVDEYDENGEFVSESYDGRHDNSTRGV